MTAPIRLLLHAGLLGLAILAAATAGAAERRALIIGNAAYPDSPLVNPVNDARDMAAMLGRLGFRIELVVDGSLARMRQSIVRFVSALREGDTAVVFYAGHGVQVDGQNYLLPVDASVDHEAGIRFSAVEVASLLDTVEGTGAEPTLVILDACRNNPFERRLRGRSRGLVAIDAARGSMIAYATAPGSVAADGSGRNGVYTGALLEALAAPGLQVEEVFKRVTAKVEAATGGQQVPWTSSSLRGRLVLNERGAPAAPPAAAAPPPAGPSTDMAVWQAIAGSASPQDFETFLKAYPDSPMAPFARSRLAELAAPSGGRTQTAAVVAPPPAAVARPAGPPALQRRWTARVRHGAIPPPGQQAECPTDLGGTIEIRIEGLAVSGEAYGRTFTGQVTEDGAFRDTKVRHPSGVVLSLHGNLNGFKAQGGAMNLCTTGIAGFSRAGD